MTTQQRGAFLLQEEIDQLNHLILQLIDIDNFTESVQDKVLDMVSDSMEDYIDLEDGTFTYDRETLIAKAVETEFENDYEGPVPTILYETVAEKFDEDVWNTVESDLHEYYTDTVEHRRDPLGYHGMKQSDFL